MIEPDELTYAILIKGYGQDIAHPQWGKIKQILQAMEAAGISLTTTTYNTLLEICSVSQVNAAVVQPGSLSLASLALTRPHARS